MKNCLFICIQAFFIFKSSNALKYYERQNGTPLIIAHRGSFGHFPEHTEAGYIQAFIDGAHFIDVDVQPTKDGQLIVHHENTLTENLLGQDDFKHIFSEEDRKTFINPLNGDVYPNDLMIVEYTAEDLKLLRRKQKYQTRSQLFNGHFSMLTLNEAIEIIQKLNNENPRRDEFPMGIYLELKSTDFYIEKYGIDVNKMVMEVLKEYSLDTYEKSLKNNVPVIIQSFYLSSLQYFKEISDLPTAFLLTIKGNHDFSAEQLRELTLFEIVGLELEFLMDYECRLNNYGNEKIIQSLHQNGLLVHPYTAKDDFIKFSNSDNVIEEYKILYDMGVDGIFTEFPRSALQSFKYFKKIED